MNAAGQTTRVSVSKMENGLYANVGLDMEGRNWFSASDRITHQQGTTSNPLLLHSFDFNNNQLQNQTVYGSMPLEPSSNSNHIGIGAAVSSNINNHSTMFHPLHPDALSYAASLQNQFPRNSLPIPGPSLVYPLEMAANYQVPNDSAVPFGYGGLNMMSNCSPELVSCWLTPSNIDCGVEFSTENHPPCCKISNEQLSLSLATSQNSVVNNGNNANRGRRHCLDVEGYEEQTCSGSKELSLSCGTYRGGGFSEVVSGSRYLNVVQEILAQIASCSLENLDSSCGRRSIVTTTGGASSQPSLCSPPSWRQSDKGEAIRSEEEHQHQGAFEVQLDPALQKRALQAKKAQLLSLLQMVDDRYNQCVDEIHTVVSAFHAATELDPQIHTRFALQTISFLYKDLKERISNQILVMGGQEEGCPDACNYLEKQWSLRQLKKKEHQFWRPQRGLPERSVSVLRAWMFQNFLHPYPKDAEKHLLAVKSGLTRSQVSNWFINARVRVWKPMIEEMYAEMNRRKGANSIISSSSNVTTSQISIRNPIHLPPLPGFGMVSQIEQCDDHDI
ncbi:Homeobox protein ATH1 [Linum perenne]